jgi:hypothetical protein
VKFIDQTTYGPSHGNCISACVASILEVPIETVPFFVDENWRERFVGWLAARGLAATELENPPPGFSIAFGPSTRLAGRGHACVARDGVIVHDPHPSRAGLPIVTHYVVLHGIDGESMWCVALRAR